MATGETYTKSNINFSKSQDSNYMYIMSQHPSFYFYLLCLLHNGFVSKVLSKLSPNTPLCCDTTVPKLSFIFNQVILPYYPVNVPLCTYSTSLAAVEVHNSEYCAVVVICYLCLVGRRNEKCYTTLYKN